MVPENTAPAWLPLRSVTQRLTSIPVTQLPQVVPFLASTISSSGTFLAEINSLTQKKRNSEEEITAHKLKTQVSTLLQDENKEARWAAVVLVKAMIERPEPSSTKKLCIICLTRIFLLTRGNQSLVREMTTPSLPPFITACMRVLQDGKMKSSQQISAHDSLLSTILWAFGKLIPLHPKIFKPFVDRIHSIIMPMIAAAPSSRQAESSEPQNKLTSCPEIVAQKARHVFVLLNFCGSTTSSSQDWEKSLSRVIEDTHFTAHVVFRGFAEESEMSIGNGSVTQNIAPHTGLYQSNEDKPGRPNWIRIHAGLERLNGQILTIQTFLQYPTPVPITVPVSKIFYLIDRILSIIPPSERASRGTDPGTPVKPELSRDEREAVWTDSGHLQGYSLSNPASNEYAMHADSYFQKPNTSSDIGISGSLQNVAASLLSAALAYLPSTFLPFSVRSKIDRSAVLAQNEELLQTSVLNAGARKGRKQQSSLLPLLSRHFSESRNTECLIRPRLPPIQSNIADLSNSGSDEEIDADKDREENIDHIMAGELNMPTMGSAAPAAHANDQGIIETGGLETETRRSKSPSLALSVKRTRDLEPSDRKSGALSEVEHLSPPDGEPQRKRMRDSADETYIPSTTEDDVPTSVAPLPTGNPAPSSAGTRPESESLAALWKADEDMANDDSDDSSIPPIDPTLDTEDEVAEDDDYENDNVE
ncbi:MAG: hypothetical protein L6R41_007682 [Letrouitia leprolyta]|nr:MAG: hypothetical protein L6R41_007682 [Letrouitia leprolyta]